MYGPECYRGLSKSTQIKLHSSPSVWLIIFSKDNKLSPYYEVHS